MPEGTLIWLDVAGSEAAGTLRTPGGTPAAPMSTGSFKGAPPVCEGDASIPFAKPTNASDDKRAESRGSARGFSSGFVPVSGGQQWFWS